MASKDNVIPKIQENLAKNHWNVIATRTAFIEMSSGDLPICEAEVCVISKDCKRSSPKFRTIVELNLVVLQNRLQTTDYKKAFYCVEHKKGWHRVSLRMYRICIEKLNFARNIDATLLTGFKDGVPGMRYEFTDIATTASWQWHEESSTLLTSFFQNRY